MGNSKKIVIMIAITFLIAVVVAFMMVFSVGKVKTEFFVYGDSSAGKIQEEFDAFKGKNMLFFNEQAILDVGASYPYYEISEVKKEFPNVVSVKVVKRTERLRVYSGNDVFVIDGDGCILNDTGKTEIETNVSDVIFDGIEITSGAVGKTIKTSDDGLFYSLLDVVNEISLNDIVKDVKVVLATEKKDLEFTTFTGVKISVLNAEDMGKEKINKAFELFDALDDYEKTCSEIQAYATVDGNVRAVWING